MKNIRHRLEALHLTANDGKQETWWSVVRLKCPTSRASYPHHRRAPVHQLSHLPDNNYDAVSPHAETLGAPRMGQHFALPKIFQH